MVRIEKATRREQLQAAAALLDGPVLAAAADRFLDEPGHHLLLAYDAVGVPVGFVSSVEMTHPDKGTEMFLYELGVADPHQRQGIGTALVGALDSLARERGCYGMWVVTDADNAAALATYRAAGGGPPTSHVMVAWEYGTVD
jgi:ribosomal protein S18 acetylase RimI-like enzyme